MGTSKITLYGGTTTDYIHLEDTTVNKTKSLVPDYTPVFNQDTALLLTFADGIDGVGMIGNLEGYVYTIYREDLTTGAVMDYVGTVTNGDLTMTDYNIANHHQYQYLIFVETAEYICTPQETDPVNTCWDSWSLIGLKETDNENEFIVDSNNIWKLNFSLESGEQTQNIERVEYKNLTRYPKISQGRANYITSTISCLLGDVSKEGKYIEDYSLLTKWREFINSSQLKLLKDRKGNRYIVQTMSSTNTTKDATVEQMNVISFGWTEVKSVENVTMTESSGEG